MSHSVRSVMSQMEVMKRFMAMQPPSFNDEPNVEAIDHWLRRMKRILVGLDILEKRRVSLSTYVLVDKADIRWETMKRVYNTEVITWEEFERIFLGKYFGENTRSIGSCTFHLAAATLHPAAATFHPDILHPALDVGWERRAFQLPWSNISESADSTHPEDFTAILHSADSVHPENFATNFAQCRGVLLKLPDMCDRHL
ncbi:hypothetical protein CK203_038750 [Vitis vinifera]|uniref:Retrotransposon gag domain-containing protein n=1 Tax=Vitis vinifera TaxID=29760 RepID=A0A438I1V9_VITVI|nr:hypothetical protein CK203_038750 [Vitis vinifera]